jgi:tetratricopeptide (TPR) repeat protein
MNMKKNSLIYIVILLAVFSWSLMGQAGYGNGRQGGLVLDENEKPIAGAKVKIEYIKKYDRVSETETDEKGMWSFANLSAGNIKVTISFSGYLTETHLLTISQVNVNAPHRARMVVDPSIKARADAEKAYEESVKALEAGNQLMKDRKFDEALAFFSDFAQKNPDVIMIQFNIAEIHREKKEFDQAKAIYQKVMDIAKEKGDVALQGKALSSFGELALRQGNLKEAQGYFEQSIALNPSDEILAYNVAEIYFGSNDTDKAIAYYNKAIQIKPTWSEPYMKIGYAYLNKGEIAKAIQSFEAFLKIEPADSEQAAIAQELIKSLK